MSNGIVIRNADGSLQMDIGSRSMRLLTVLDIGATTSGSVDVPALAEAVAIIQHDIKPGAYTPTVTVSGTNVSWNYGSVSQRDTDYRAMVMAY